MFCLACCLLSVGARTTLAQLNVLSTGDAKKEWHKTQLLLLEQQLEDETVTGELREEVLAQQKWLSTWKPGALTDEPLWEAPRSVAKPLQEPVVDPNGLAADLRARLLGPKAKPTIKDTNSLQELLARHSEDVGVRQLHLHWLDQTQYRKTYPRQIAAAAMRLLGMLEQMEPEDEEVQLAKAFCLYRRVRALAYRELPEVLREQPLEDPEQFESELLGAFDQLIALSGKGRSEFVLIENRMLRRDRFYGRALVQLTDYAEQIEPQLFLKKRRDLLRELGWEQPAQEAAEIYALAFPEEVQAENEAQAGAEHAPKDSEK